MTARGPMLCAPNSGVTLRLLGRNDEQSVAELLHGTSNESLHQRFFTVPSHAHLRAEIERLTRPASRRHAAVGAEVAGKLVGVASFERDDEADDRAELAILVDDSYQGRGIGRRLLERLAEVAHDQQVTELTASVLASNVRMLRLVRSTAASATSHLADGVIDVTVPLQHRGPNETRTTAGVPQPSAGGTPVGTGRSPGRRPVQLTLAGRRRAPL